MSLLRTCHFDNTFHSQRLRLLSHCLHSNYLTLGPHRTHGRWGMEVFIIPISQIKKVRHLERNDSQQASLGLTRNPGVGVRCPALVWCVPTVCPLCVGATVQGSRLRVPLGSI